MFFGQTTDIIISLQRIKQTKADLNTDSKFRSNVCDYMLYRSQNIEKYRFCGHFGCHLGHTIETTT